MADTTVKMVINAATWKLKVFNAVAKFLNWCTIPKLERKKGEMVINIRFEVE